MTFVCRCAFNHLFIHSFIIPTVAVAPGKSYHKWRGLGQKYINKATLVTSSYNTIPDCMRMCRLYPGNTCLGFYFYSSICYLQSSASYSPGVFLSTAGVYIHFERYTEGRLHQIWWFIISEWNNTRNGDSLSLNLGCTMYGDLIWLRNKSFKSIFAQLDNNSANAVTKLRMCYPWRHSLLVLRRNIGNRLILALYLWNNHTVWVAIDRRYGIKNTTNSICGKIVISQLIWTRIKSQVRNKWAT